MKGVWKLTRCGVIDPLQRGSDILGLHVLPKSFSVGIQLIAPWFGAWNALVLTDRVLELDDPGKLLDRELMERLQYANRRPVAAKYREMG
jgi:hypothetical protein